MVTYSQFAFYPYPLNTVLVSSFTQVQQCNCMYLLNKAHVGLAPGEAFGAPGYIRISYAASEVQLKEAAVRMKNALALLTPLKVASLEK